MKRKSNTCIAVLKHPKTDKLYFAGDRRVSTGHFINILPHPKVSFRDGVLLGGTGLSYLCDEIVKNFPIPKRKALATLDDYVHKSLLPALIAWLKANNWVEDDSRSLSKPSKFDDDDFGATVLVGIDNSLYELTVDTSLISIDHIETPHAVGCGADFALGSLLTTEDTKTTPTARLKLALKVAAMKSAGCDDNIDVIHN